MKLVKIFSVLGLVLVATACGSSQPTTAVVGANTSAYSQYGNAYGNGQALYNSAGQIIGYKSTTTLIAGSGQAYAQSGNGSYFPVNVNAGDQISYNTSGGAYKVGSTACLAGLITFTTNLNTPYPLSDSMVTFNGQPIANGAVVPSSGVIALSLPPLSAGCTVSSYLVYLPYGVSKVYCTNTSGAAMPCP